MNQIKNQEIIDKIGKRIATLRKSKGLSREKVAFRIGISPQQLFKYEAGENRVSVDRLITIILALDLKLTDFFPASEFGDKIGNLLTAQNLKQAKMLNDFAKFKKLSTEELVVKILKLLIE